MRKYIYILDNLTKKSYNNIVYIYHNGVDCMNKGKWIWLAVVLVVVILLGSIAIKHRNSIEALIDSFRYSQEEVQGKLGENKEQLQEYIDKNKDITVRDLTKEESEALSKGDLTEEEAVKVLTGQETEQNQPDGTIDTKPEENKPEEKPVSTVVSEAIAKLYIQKSIYLGKLDGIEASLKQQYIDIVKSNKLYDEEKKNAKYNLIKQNISKVSAWETECDSVVYGILDEITVALNANNEDTGIVKKLEEAYLNEKRLKKSYFINRYMD